ncbi:MAG TPA: hypothetical protein VK473_12735 [Terriglobales bacterium]|nr:hypothetical protein [Terriglobales bacterium]
MMATTIRFQRKDGSMTHPGFHANFKTALEVAWTAMGKLNSLGDNETVVIIFEDGVEVWRSDEDCRDD